MTWVLLPFTFQIVLQSIVLWLIALIFGKPAGFREGVALIRWHDWWDYRWPFVTCIGFVMGGSDRALQDRSVWFHEVGVHVKQFEDLAVLSDVVAGVVLLYGYLTGHTTWPLALGIWASGGPLWLLPNFLTALRFRKAGKELDWRTWRTMYMMSEHERSAYAQEAQFVRNGGTLHT